MTTRTRRERVQHLLRALRALPGVSNAALPPPAPGPSAPAPPASAQEPTAPFLPSGMRRLHGKRNVASVNKGGLCQEARGFLKTPACSPRSAPGRQNPSRARREAQRPKPSPGSAHDSLVQQRCRPTDEDPGAGQLPLPRLVPHQQAHGLQSPQRVTPASVRTIFPPEQRFSRSRTKG